MPNRPLLATHSLILHHDAAQACLRANWQLRQHAPASSLSYQHILLGVQQTQSTKLLNDCLLLSNGWQEVATWLAHGYFEQLAQAGIRRVAWVLPAPAPTNLRPLLRNLRSVLTDTFSDVAAASDWLSQERFL